MTDIYGFSCDCGACGLGAGWVAGGVFVAGALAFGSAGFPAGTLGWAVFGVAGEFALGCEAEGVAGFVAGPGAAFPGEALPGVNRSACCGGKSLGTTAVDPGNVGPLGGGVAPFAPGAAPFAAGGVALGSRKPGRRSAMISDAFFWSAKG